MLAAVHPLLSGGLRAAAACGVLAAAVTLADVPAGQRAEVDHLLAFIETSDCEFVRNGRRYGSERALRHVQRKYDYFRDEISSTEQFIELAASRSERSGRPYRFDCGGDMADARDVLLAELARFRAGRER